MEPKTKCVRQFDPPAAIEAGWAFFIVITLLTGTILQNETLAIIGMISLGSTVIVFVVAVLYATIFPCKKVVVEEMKK